MIKFNVVQDCKFWTKKIGKKEIFFASILSFLPKKYKFAKKKLSLTILLTNNLNIRKLNYKFRKKNKSTDVLSFPSEQIINIKRNSYLGDIAISYEFMNEKKNLSNLEFKKKLAKTFIHGFLHLLGFDHIKLKDFKKMNKEEEKICSIINTKIVKSV